MSEPFELCATICLTNSSTAVESLLDSTHSLSTSTVALRSAESLNDGHNVVKRSAVGAIDVDGEVNEVGELLGEDVAPVLGALVVGFSVGEPLG